MARWQAKLEQRQAFLGRIVDIGAELFAIAAAVVYADTIRRETPERGESAYELAGLFAAQARRRVDALFTALWHNDDDAGYKTAQKVLDGQFTWLEEGILEQSADKPQVAGQPGQAADTAAGQVNGNGAAPVAAEVH
jgi:hypothetical protein